MTTAISEYLPMAVGVAISPLPIIAMIVLCVIGKGKSQGTLYLLGWFFAIIGFMVLTVLIGNGADAGTEAEPSTWSILLQFGFAFLLLWLAWDNWRKRPKEGEPIKEPGWVAGLSNSSTAGIIGLAIMMAIVNAKNLPIMASAAVMIAQKDGSWSAGLLDAALFAFIASLGLLIPWLIALIGGDKVKPMLERMQAWLYRYNNIIMTLLFGFLGINALSAALALVT